AQWSPQRFGRSLSGAEGRPLHLPLLLGLAVLAVGFAEAPVRLRRELLLAKAAFDERLGDCLDDAYFARDVELAVAFGPGRRDRSDQTRGIAGIATFALDPGDTVSFRAFVTPGFAVGDALDLQEG